MEKQDSAGEDEGSCTKRQEDANKCRSNSARAVAGSISYDDRAYKGNGGVGFHEYVSQAWGWHNWFSSGLSI